MLEIVFEKADWIKARQSSIMKEDIIPETMSFKNSAALAP